MATRANTKANWRRFVQMEAYRHYWKTVSHFYGWAVALCFANFRQDLAALFQHVAAFDAGVAGLSEQPSYTGMCRSFSIYDASIYANTTDGGHPSKELWANQRHY